MSKHPFRFSTSLEVRWRDVDALAHVNNAVYFNYLEQARLHYISHLGFQLEKPTDVGMIIAEASCRYKSPLRLGEKITIFLRTSDLRRSSFTFKYRLEGEDGRLAATARTVQVCYDYATERVIPIPQKWRTIFTAYEPGLQSTNPSNKGDSP